MELKRPDGQGAQGDLAEPVHAAGAPFCIARVDELERMLGGAKLSFEFHRDTAMHAFANGTPVGANRLPTTEYNADAAALAWGRTRALFDKHLR